MTTSIIGLFETTDIASKVLGELTKAGFKKDAVEILQDVAVSRISSLVEAAMTRTRLTATARRCRRAALWSWPKLPTTRPTMP